MSTNIEWTDETLNIIVGCSRVPGSPACKNCYAATAAESARLQQFPQYQKVAAWDGTQQGTVPNKPDWYVAHSTLLVFAPGYKTKWVGLNQLHRIIQLNHP